MRTERHLEVLLAQGRLLAAVPVESLDAPVPSVPGWNVEAVVRHTGKVHHWVTAALTAGPGADLGAVAADLPGMPKGPACLPAYAEAMEGVHAALASLDPEQPVATFVGEGTVAFWRRRQAHEVSIHRLDVEDGVHAAGGAAPSALPLDVAVDGIDEWASLFLATRWNQRFGAFPDDLDGRSVHVHGTDDPPLEEPAEWLFEFGAGAVQVTTGHAKGDVALRGPAEQLLLALWRRRPIDGLDVVGDRALAERLVDVARF